MRFDPPQFSPPTSTANTVPVGRLSAIGRLAKFSRFTAESHQTHRQRRNGEAAVSPLVSEIQQVPNGYCLGQRCPEELMCVVTAVWLPGLVRRKTPRLSCATCFCLRSELRINACQWTSMCPRDGDSMPAVEVTQTCKFCEWQPSEAGAVDKIASSPPPIHTLKPSPQCDCVQ